MQQRLSDGVSYDTRRLKPLWLWHNGLAPDHSDYARVIAYAGPLCPILWIRTGVCEGAYDELVALPAVQAQALYQQLVDPINDSVRAVLHRIGKHGTWGLSKEDVS